VCEFFFLLTGVGYLFSFLSWRNDFYPFEAEIFLRLADIPLAFFGILYGITSLRLSLILNDDNKQEEKSISLLDVFLFLLAMTMFSVIVYIDILLPNILPFPKIS
jgi:hypothetical protein